ncbi:ROK family protein [Bacteroidales bacterium]|nr:ROK family protein [Bacteroidales bacterium]
MNDKIIMILDAGGTNFVFTAIQNGEEIVDPINLLANGDDLEKCIANMVSGFQQVKEKVPVAPAAISFAFPGPADYPQGLIGYLKNLPGFYDGVPLASILEGEFNIPVYINNDGDLYAYGEAMHGFLPELNHELQTRGINKEYRNLAAVTLGTGLGGGMVRNGELFIGDNSMGMEIWTTGNRYDIEGYAENNVSTRAIKRFYKNRTGVDGLMPKDIYDIAMGQKEGDVQAAENAFEEFGNSLGDVLANMITIFDCNVVMGGGLVGASPLFMPAVLAQINGYFDKQKQYRRITQEVFDYDTQKEAFLENKSGVKVKIPHGEGLIYNPSPKVAIATSKLGASKAIALGAYAYAIKKLH